MSESTTKNFFAGGFGGICLVAAGHPLDTVKVRMQTMPKHGMPPYSDTFDCIRKIFLNEGFKGFYKGMGTPIIGITPLYSITFFGYSLGKKLQTAALANNQYSHAQIFNAGMLSSVFTTFIAAPGEQIKCLLQVQAVNSQKTVQPFKGPLDCAIKLYQEGGLAFLFRGTFATFLRDVPAGGVYFVTYESLKQKFDSSKKFTVSKTLIAGGCAGLAFWTIAIPADVLKSRLQTSSKGQYPNGLRDVFREIFRNQGLFGFYSGATAVYLRAFPANAACFVGYELAMKVINWLAPSL